MKTYFVVTSVVMHNDKVLLLKKSDDDYLYPGKWSFCSGYVKEYESAEDTALREIMEETGLDGTIVKSGGIVQKEDSFTNRRWVLAVFLCSVESDNVNLCHENSDFSWVDKDKISCYDLVPGLAKDLKTLGLD